MCTIDYIKQYLDYCTFEKQLSKRTIKSYRLDLKHYKNFLIEQVNSISVELVNKTVIRDYIRFMHTIYVPKSIERKIISLKAFYNFLYYEEIIDESPFEKLIIKNKISKKIPEVLTVRELKIIMDSVYDNDDLKRTSSSRTYLEAVRSIVMIELFISTGIRVGELLSIRRKDVDLTNRTLLIRGKGNKERLLYISSDGTLKSMIDYFKLLGPLERDELIFKSRRGMKLKDDHVRSMVKKHSKDINKNVTPHMFRHAFATLLMDEGVNISHIQKLLGHHSIVVTQIYTHVSIAHLKNILQKYNPRNQLETPYLNFRTELYRKTFH